MVRLAGVRERRDKTWYDTNRIDRGKSVEFFGNANIGDKFLTNIQVANSIAPGSTYMAFVLGARLIGKTREQEDLLLDHLRVELIIGDKSCYDALGPQVSMLRHVFLRSELERLEKEARACDTESAWMQGEKKWESPALRVGYHFGKPLMIPPRMPFHVNVMASSELPEPVDMRVHLFGLETRDVA